MVVTPPTYHPAVGDWDKYTFKVCPTKPASACFDRDCSPVSASPATTSCALTGLKADTQYSVEAVAVKATADPAKPIKSDPTSALATFTTVAYP